MLQSRSTASWAGIRGRVGLCAAVALSVGLAVPPAAWSQEVLWSTEGNRLRRFDVGSIDAPPLAEQTLVERAADAPGSGRDINGMICPLPDGSGGVIAGEDTGQPTPPAGWGVFDRNGTQVGKLTATYQVAGPEPFGCAFLADGRLLTTDVGNQGFGAGKGQLSLWFPDPVDGFATFPGPPGAYPATNASSTRYCKLAVDLSTAGAVAVDDQGRVYVAQASGFQITRFLPPFPTGLGPGEGCEDVDATGAPLAENVTRELFAVAPDTTQLFTPTGLAFAENGNVLVSSVATGQIGEWRTDGRFVRWILEPGQPQPLTYPLAEGTPQGIAVGGDGSVYYADLDLRGPTPADLGPGPDGKVRRIRFDALGDPLPPETVRAGLAFPDGVLATPVDLTQWRSHAGGPRRLFFNAAESQLGPDNATSLTERWRLPTNAIITGSPVVAALFLPGAGPVQVIFFQSWDLNVYAVHLETGDELWRFTTAEQPGATFPQAASLHVERIDGREIVYAPAGETLHALDAKTGQEIWRFEAGTGCVDALGQPPGLCGMQGERNEILSSPAVVGGDTVVFGMDVNDTATGKGGFYGVDARTGSLSLYLDLESGAIDASGGFTGVKVCRPLPGDDVRRFDGYHGEAELGLPAGFLATRPGCDFPRTPNGCGNVWSSAAVDVDRGLLFFATSNCDTDTDPATNEPPPPMPLFDEAVVALAFDGTPAWTWRAREVDNDDLAYGGVPNLFSIDVGGGLWRDVVGIGNKDGSYQVLDREGVNVVNGVAWDDVDPSMLPYWRTQVVAGGSVGGVVATAAVDEAARRVFFSTAPGEGANVPPGGVPQQPTVHALDLDTGAIAWQNTTESGGAAAASFAPTSAIPGLVFIGNTFPALERYYDTRADAGTKLGQIVRLDGPAIAMAPAVIDGTVLLGAGIGARGTGPSDASSRIPADLVAYCVPGTPDCRLPACKDGLDNDGDGDIDGAPAGSDAGCSDPLDRSEVAGDLDFDGDLDYLDRLIFSAAFGLFRGDAGWAEFADLDRDADVDVADSKLFNALFPTSGAPTCGLGPELVPLLAGVGWWRRRRAQAARGGPR